MYFQNIKHINKANKEKHCLLLSFEVKKCTEQKHIYKQVSKNLTTESLNKIYRMTYSRL